MFRLAIAFWVATIVTVGADVVSLTLENYDELTVGKTVFIKFFAPWCGHCQKMAPDFRRLSKEWEGHEIGLIAEVDCTDEEGKPLCSANEIQGYPTLKYGDPADLQDYTGSRTFDEMKEFADEFLVKPVCSAINIDACEDDKKALIQKMMTMSQADLEKAIKDAENTIKELEQNHKNSFDELQATYMEKKEETREKQRKITGGSLAFMKDALSLKSEED